MSELKKLSTVELEALKEFRERYQDSPDRLKYIDANERRIEKEESLSARIELFKVLDFELRTWDPDLKNPFQDEELEITGFAKLVQDISEYESDTFSASSNEIKASECMEIANKIIDIWKEDHLDGVIISSLLEDLRDEYESAKN
jgi:hypothetical protein